MKKSGIILSFLICVNSLSGQTSDDESRPKLTFSANEVVQRIIDGKQIIHLLGDVHFIQGDAHIRSNEANYNEESDMAFFIRDVIINDGKRELRADFVQVDGMKKQETARGNVILENNNHRIFADEMIYFREEEIAEAKGRVKILDLIEYAELSAENVHYNRQNEYAKAYGNPRIMVTDSTHSDTLYISGISVEVWGENQRAVVQDSVIIKNKNMESRCGDAVFFADQDSVMLNNMPKVFQDNQTITGDTIFLNLFERSFDRGKVVGKARIVAEDSLYTDVMTGDFIHIATIDDSTRKITVEGQASSEYHVDDEKTQGVNSIAGDRIIMYFENNRLTRLTVDSKPGLSKGQFKPKEENTKTSDGFDGKS